jgi:hypothetical protein
MANYGNTHIGGRSIFATRKVRSNKGVKRGPRVAPVMAPTNVVMVNAGGVAHVQAAPKARRVTVGPRKPRSNKGTKRVSKYATNENRKAAKRAAARRYYARKRAGLVNLPRL